MITVGGKLYKRLVKYGTIKLDNVHIEKEEPKEKLKENPKEELQVVDYPRSGNMELRSHEEEEEQDHEEEKEEEVKIESPQDILDEDQQLKKKLTILVCNILNDLKIKGWYRNHISDGVDKYYDML